MAFLRKHLFLVLCAAAVLIGVGLLAMGLVANTANQKSFAELKRQTDAVPRLAVQAVHNDEIEYYKKQADRIRRESQEIERQALQTTKRPLIHSRVFPEPPADSWKLYYREFADTYCATVADLLRQLNAKDRPSDMEIKLHSGGTASGTTDRTDRRESQDKKLSEELSRERAIDISVYASPGIFSCYNEWNSQDWETADKEVLFVNGWFTQIAAWIQEDIVQAIRQINADSQTVADSQVKHLVNISFAGKSFGGRMAVRSSLSGSGATGRRSSGARRLAKDTHLPAYVLRDPKSSTAGLTGQMVLPWTKRCTESIYDVVHFGITVVIDTTAINDFMNILQDEKTTPASAENGTGTLRRSQITVLQCDILPLDNKAAQAERYYYGPGSLAEVQLVCEYIFFRKAYDHLKPQAVKDLLKPR